MNYKNPFIKVTWKDTPENFTPERIRRVKSYFQEKYNSKNIQVITKNLSSTHDTKLQSLDVSDSITDNQYQKTLMKDFIKENSINVKWDMLDRLDNKVNSEIDKNNQNKIRYNKWYIKRVTYSNFLSFGQDNVIDFTTLDGITVIESTPKNFGGKSTSTVDLLMFLFFNSTTKTKTNVEIFNKFTDKDEVSVIGEISIDGDDYVIERKIVRKKSKTNEYNVANKLEFYKKKKDGTIENLSGEQRRETEDFISSAIGSQEDFLSTILTTGYNLEELIESKPTARGQILTKFLGLENLKIKEETCKTMYNEWSRKLLSNTHNQVEIELENSKFTQSITESIEELKKLNKNLLEFKKTLQELELRRDSILGSRNNDIDADLMRTNPDTLQKEIDEISASIKKIEKQADDVEVKEPSEYYLEDEHKKLSDEINKLKVKELFDSGEIDKNRKLIKQFEEGSICPTCNRALEDVDHTEEINNLKELIKKQDKNLEKLNQLISEKSKEDIKMVELKQEYDTYEKNKLRKAKFELESEQKKVDMNSKLLKLDKYRSNKKKLEENQKIDNELVTLRTKIQTSTGDITQTNNNIQKHTNNIDTLNEKILVNLQLISKIKSEEELATIFKIYLTIYGKNGISKVILKNMIPLLNVELHRLLTDSCHFILELIVNDKNEVEFVMIDNETRVIKPLNAGSGYERTISSLAIRSVLTKISSLPKPNIVVMDEVFGKVADENLEMVGEFFKKIKNYFDHIFVISHNSLIRNWSDNIIMIKKEENVSSIDFITTKIS